MPGIPGFPMAVAYLKRTGLRIKAFQSAGRGSLALLAGRLLLACLLLFLYGCDSGGGTSVSSSGGTTGGSSGEETTNVPPVPAIIVNSAEDLEQPPAGTMTLRAAIALAEPGDRITFSPLLNGATITLSIVADEHTALPGEVYSGMTFTGYADRDYGKSALYARKSLTIDAADLPDGIMIRWGGGDANRARVLAVYGNLTMKNVAITSGYSLAEPIPASSQLFTLGRGGGLAVWGTATLENCIVSGNKAEGDTSASRDRGTYGGGIYANGLALKSSVVSGNAVIGYGAAGGGIYSVGGADNSGGIGNNAILENCTVSGNRVTAQHAYGGGIFTLAGGPNNRAWLRLTNCTVARNLVEDNAALPQAGQYYYRGGGIYMGGGSLTLASCTVAENEVNGTPATFSGKPNIGGGGIAATIGNAHVVEDVIVQHSIVAGNRVNGSTADWFAGSILNFYSRGYNRFGSIDFSQILVPVPDWFDLSRKHYPKVGDLDGITLDQVLAVGEARYHPAILSAGTDAGEATVLWYPPANSALDQVPSSGYYVASVAAGYQGFGVGTDDFLNQVLLKLRTDYAATLGSDFGTAFGDLTGTTWYGPAGSWPANPDNAPWISFWRNLDVAIAGRLGTVTLGDAFWESFNKGPLGNVTMSVTTNHTAVTAVRSDQLGNSRPAGLKGDIGAIEKLF